MTLRKEIEDLIQEGIGSDPFVLDMKVFGEQQAIQGVVQDPLKAVLLHVGTLAAWVEGLHIAVLRIADEIDQPGGAQPPEPGQ